MIVWCLAVLALLLAGCDAEASREAPAVSAPLPPPISAPVKTSPPSGVGKKEPDRDDIKSALRATEAARELLDRHRYIIESGADKDTSH